MTGSRGRWRGCDVKGVIESLADIGYKSVFKIRTSSFVHERSFVVFAIVLPYPIQLPTIGRCLKTNRAPNLRRSRPVALYHEQYAYHVAMWITVASLKRPTKH